MPPPDTAPLTSDERVLARGLAGLDAAAEPSAALDARVLAAALETQARPVRPKRRWPALVGLAASLVLVAGVAWRVLPLARGPSPISSAHDTGDRRAVRHAGNGRPAPPMPPPPDLLPSAADSEVSAPVRATSTSQRAKKSGASPDPATVLDAPAVEPDAEPDSAPVETAASVAAPPPPDAAADPDIALPSVVPPEAAMDQDAAREADQRSAAGHGDEPEDDVPPATADAPEVRDAWLQRIRGLLDSGDINGARSSLHAFEQRYPDFAVPEDLRALGR